MSEDLIRELKQNPQNLFDFYKHKDVQNFGKISTLLRVARTMNNPKAPIAISLRLYLMLPLEIWFAVFVNQF